MSCCCSLISLSVYHINFCSAVQDALTSILQHFCVFTISEYALYQISCNGCKVTALSYVIPTSKHFGVLKTRFSFE